MEPEQPGQPVRPRRRPGFFVFSELAHEQLGGRDVSEAGTTYRGQIPERIWMTSFAARDDRIEMAKAMDHDGSISVKMWIMD